MQRRSRTKRRRTQMLRDQMAVEAFEKLPSKSLEDLTIDQLQLLLEKHAVVPPVIHGTKRLKADLVAKVQQQLAVREPLSCRVSRALDASVVLTDGQERSNSNTNTNTNTDSNAFARLGTQLVTDMMMRFVDTASVVAWSSCCRWLRARLTLSLKGIYLYIYI
jgi:hypothetical protein